MKYMLDTNTCIYLIKNKPSSVLKELQKHSPEDICISSITYSELLYGCEKSKLIERNKIVLSMFLSNISVLDFGIDAANEYGNIRAVLENKGKVIGLTDLLIASHCRSLGYTLVTNNEKEFKRVENLKVINWVN